MEISIIIVNWNTRDMLAACLQSIQEYAAPVQVQTLVVDNNSSDGSREMVTSRFPWVELINSGGNIGFSRANNLALPRATAPFVLYLNPDTELRPEALEKMLEFLRLNAQVGAVGCKLTDAAGRVQPLGLQVFPTPLRECIRMGFYSETLGRRWPRIFRWKDAGQSDSVLKLFGACILARRDVLDRVGAFDERYFMYCEDVDLCRSIIEKGWSLHYLADVSIIHHGAGASAKAPGAFAILMTCQSISKYMRKYYGWPGQMLHRCLMLGAGLIRLAVAIPLALSKQLRGGNSSASIDFGKRYWIMVQWALGLKHAQIAADKPRSISVPAQAAV